MLIILITQLKVSNLKRNKNVNELAYVLSLLKHLYR